MNKLKFIALASLISTSAFAAGGFNWMNGIAHALHVPQQIVTFGSIGLIVILIGLIYLAKLSSVKNTIIPDKGVTIRNLVEAYGQFIYNQCNSVIGEDQGYKYFPFIATLFLFIFLSNIIGLVPGFLPPTEFLSTTFALGTVAFVYYNIKGCKEVGTLNYIKHFAGPLWYMAFIIFPIEILSNFIRPVSLALRLRGNMYGDHIVLSVFSDMAPLIIPVIFLFLGLLVSAIQAFVFTSLTMVYISLATAHHDHDDH